MKSGGAFYQTTRMSFTYLKVAVEQPGKRISVGEYRETVN
jgi:hypothetical protein